MKEKKWLKYLCLFALALLVAIPAAGVKEAQAATVSGSCGDKATYAYDEDTGKLTISGSGTVEYTSDWDDIVENVKTIVIGDKITKLKSVVIGEKVTGIGDLAFYQCSKLKTVTIGAGGITIASMAFSFSTSLKTVKFKGAAPESVAENAFAGVTVTIKYPSSGKSSWTKSLRS